MLGEIEVFCRETTRDPTSRLVFDFFRKENRFSGGGALTAFRLDKVLFCEGCEGNIFAS